MNRNMLVILAAGVDIWAALYLTQLLRAPSSWEVRAAMGSTNSSRRSPTTDDALQQVWLAPGRMGIWPDRGHDRTMRQVEAHLAEAVRRNGGPVSLRLLCDPALEIRDWSQVAAKLSRHVNEIRIAPLPPVAVEPFGVDSSSADYAPRRKHGLHIEGDERAR